MRLFALLPAAGLSRRMGTPKLALCLHGRTVLERAIDAVRQGGAEQVLVVLAPHVAFLAEIASAAGAEVLLLDAATSDMRATLERGLERLETLARPGPDDAFLLVPADHPTLDSAVVRNLVQALVPPYSIAIPTWEGKRGHPALIGWRHVAGIRAWPPDQGVNAYLRSRADETVLIPWTGEEVLLDLDTPEDWIRLEKTAPPPN